MAHSVGHHVTYNTTMPVVPSTVASRRQRERARRGARDRARRRATWIGRVVLFLLAVGILSAALVPVLVDPGHEFTQRTATVRVVEGESLWDVASRVGPEDATTNETLRAIRTLNELEGSCVQAGQVLAVPAPEEPTRIASR